MKRVGKKMTGYLTHMDVPRCLYFILQIVLKLQYFYCLVFFCTTNIIVVILYKIFFYYKNFLIDL